MTRLDIASVACPADRPIVLVTLPPDRFDPLHERRAMEGGVCLAPVGGSCRPLSHDGHDLTIDRRYHPERLEAARSRWHTWPPEDDR